MKQYVIHSLLSIALASAASTIAPGKADAQDQQRAPPRTQDQMRDAIYLAGTLGSVHAIRVKCNGRDDQYWRVKMKDLLDLEAPNGGGLRSSMARAFNDAYTNESRKWRGCTTAAVAAEAEYAAEGRELADKLAMSYFPKR